MRKYQNENENGRPARNFFLRNDVYRRMICELLCGTSLSK